MGERELAIVREPGWGMRDFTSRPGLWFTVRFGEGGGALLCFFGEEAEEIMAASKAYDVSRLNGKPCFVRVDDNLVKFDGWADF